MGSAINGYKAFYLCYSVSTVLNYSSPFSVVAVPCIYFIREVFHTHVNDWLVQYVPFVQTFQMSFDIQQFWNHRRKEHPGRSLSAFEKSSCEVAEEDIWK